MNRAGVFAALIFGASVAMSPTVIHGQQDGVPSLTTDDVRNDPNSVTRARVEAEAAKAAPAETAATTPATRVGYVRVTTPSGYRFERPAAWEPIDDLAPQNAPSFFKYDAIFQDPKTGAVLSAISVDRSQVQSPVDISDAASVNTLLATMLNPTNSKDGVKIFRQLTGDGPNGAKWLRIKAQGTGQTVDGAIVETLFWVQLIQTESKLALVAVGYPASQQDAAAQPAFHAVRTLEFSDVTGSESAPEAGRPEN